MKQEIINLSSEEREIIHLLSVKHNVRMPDMLRKVLQSGLIVHATKEVGLGYKMRKDK